MKIANDDETGFTVRYLSRTPSIDALVRRGEVVGKELTEDLLSDTTTYLVLQGLGHFLAMATVIRPPGCRQTNTCLMSPVHRTIRDRRSFLVIVSVDVTPHRFILIRSGMWTPGASVCPPPATDP